MHILEKDTKNSSFHFRKLRRNNNLSLMQTEEIIIIRIEINKIENGKTIK